MILRLLVASFVLTLTLPTLAQDASQQAARERPEKIDTSTTWAASALSVSYVIDHDKVPLNAIHTWTFTLTNSDGAPFDDAEIMLSADMPEHLHGMTTRPKITRAAAPGQYLVEGMNFHMPGWWEVKLDISKGNSRYLVLFNLLVGEDIPMKMDHEMPMKMNKLKVVE